MNNVTNNKKYWIDFLKLISMFGVFFGHYFGLIKYSTSNEILNSRIGIFVKYFNILFNENYYMLIFCFVSGYLAYNNINKITDFNSLCNKVLSRYLRFLFPLILCSFYIYILYLLFGNNSFYLSIVFKNEWIIYNNSYKLVDLILSCFKTILISDTTIASPLWMLSNIYRTNILIYVFLYLKRKLNKILIILCLIILLIFTILFNGRSIGLIIWIGFFYAHIEDKIQKLFFNFKFNSLILIILCLVIYDIISIIKDYAFVRLFIVLITVILFSFINFNIRIHGLISKNITFIFYIIHSPIICTFTGYLFKTCAFNNNNYVLFLVTFLPTFVFCTLSSILIELVQYKFKIYLIKN